MPSYASTACPSCLLNSPPRKSGHLVEEALTGTGECLDGTSDRKGESCVCLMQLYPFVIASTRDEEALCTLIDRRNSLALPPPPIVT